MDEKEISSNLKYLINKYIIDKEYRKKLLDLVDERGGSIAKGILDDINNSNVPFDDNDSNLIKNIAFYYT